MKLKFKHKVFLAFFLNSLAVVVCVILIGRHYTARNFEEYVGKMEMERLDELAAILSLEYTGKGDWSAVVDNWDQWLPMKALGTRKLPEHFGQEQSVRPFPPPLPFLMMEKNPEEGKKQGAHGPDVLPPPPDTPSTRPDGFGPGPPGFPPSPADRHGFFSRIVLFDPDGQPLTPRPASVTLTTDDCRIKPVTVEGRTVGWVGIRSLRHPGNPLDVEFVGQQLQTLYSVGGVALILAVLITLFLSRHLMAPLKALAAGTRALTDRKFETRINVRSHDEFGQLAEDFNAMAGALERYEQMSRQWIADIAHELRTPLAILRGEIEAMQDGVREINREALDSLHFEVEHVIRIVHDLHDLSLIESMDFDFVQTAVSPVKVLNETLNAFGMRFEHTGIEIDVDGLCSQSVMITADAGRLKQLFSNLLENTLRYVHVPGVLKIDCENTSEHLMIHFEDSGPGVPKESLDRLFNRLYRVDKARSRAHGGSGLGLAICRSIVESFGGKIEASHALSGGLRISLTFPLIASGRAIKR